MPVGETARKLWRQVKDFSKRGRADGVEPSLGRRIVAWGSAAVCALLGARVAQGHHSGLTGGARWLGGALVGVLVGLMIAGAIENGAKKKPAEA